MLTCREGRHLTRPLLAITLSSLVRAGTSGTRQICPQRLNPVLRYLATRPATLTGTGPILTLAYKTKSLVSQVLPSVDSGATLTGSSEFWEDVLTNACDNYASPAQRPARVVVCGADSWSYSEDLVTALLTEPLASDDNVNEMLRTRHQNRSRQKPLHVSYAKSVVVDTDSVQVPSTYLQQFSHPIQVTEIHSKRNTQALDGDSFLTLFKADLPIIVINPITTSLVGLLQLCLPSNTILALVSPAAKAPDCSHPVLALALAQYQATICVDPPRAMKALTVLHADPTSPLAIQRYQDDFVSSGVPAITQTLHRALDLPSDTLLTPLRANIALAHLRSALSTCQDFLNSAKGDITAVLIDISSLRAKMEEARQHALAQMFGSPQTKRTNWGSIWPPIMRSKEHDRDPPSATEEKMDPELNEVADALSQSQRHMRGIMDDWTWWRVVWRIDEITNLIRTAVERTWCRELEKKLIMHTGRLIYLQQDFTTQVFSLLSKYRGKHPFNSALIHNSLQQECASPFYKLTSSSLIEPLHKRKLQLIEYPTTQLHLGGQRALIGMSTGIATSAAFSWAGWFGWLSGAGLSAGTDSALLQALSSTANIGLEPTAAMSLGTLGALASIRWAIGKWEKSKKRWWEDWERLNQGLERDLEVTLEKVMKEKVIAISESGCASLRNVADKRKDEIEIFDKERQALLSELDDLEKTDA